MMTRTMLEGAALLSPYEQGDLDDLCGLYAAINAIAVVMAPVAPLSHSQAVQLMATGIDHLSRRKLLTDAVTDGMEPPAQYALTCKLAKKAGRLSRIAFDVRRPASKQKPFDRRGLHSILDNGLDAGAALIVCLENTLDHYTVIVGRSATRYYLHDSCGLRWIARHSLSYRDTKEERRHQISSEGILRLSLTN